MNNEILIDYIENLIFSFDINNILHCQILLFLIYNNTYILQNADNEINILLNSLLKKIGKQMDINNLILIGEKEKKVSDLMTVLPASIFKEFK